MSYHVVNAEIRRNLLILLRPLVHVNFILGTCPCVISPEGHIKTPLKYFNFIRFFLIVTLLILLSISPLLKACLSLYFSSPVVDSEFNVNRNYFSSSMKTSQVVGVTLTKYVDIACGFYANLIPAVFLCMATCKRKQILAFFDTMSNYAHGIIGFGDHAHVQKVTKRLFWMHSICGVVLSIMLALRFILNSEGSFGPGSMALEWFLSNSEKNGDEQRIETRRLITWTLTPFFVYLCIAKTAVTAFIEVCCVALSSCFCKVIENIQAYLNDVMKNWSKRFLDDPLSTSILNHRTGSSCSESSEKVYGDPRHQENNKKSNHIPNDFEKYLAQIRGGSAGDRSSVPRYLLNSGILTGYPPHQQPRTDFCDCQELTPGQETLFVINKFQTVRNMQTAANGLFGCVLALNTGLTMFMCVVLKYMLIWNFGHLMMKHQANNNETTHSFWPSININQNRTAGNGDPSWVTSTPLEWSLFALLDCCFSLRLCVLVISLGNVHYNSVKFNGYLAQALLQAQKISEVMEAQGLTTGVNKPFQGRLAITQSEGNTVLAFITENSANPMAFSAAGLFCFSRNLILVIFSIITTYLVFLLQV